MASDRGQREPAGCRAGTRCGRRPGCGRCRPPASARAPARRRRCATTVWPTILALLRRPRLRCLEILMKSSRKPTRPMPTKRKSSSSADAEGALWVMQLGREVADDGRQDDDHAAHGGRAALGVVAGRTVVADLLAVAPAGEPGDRHPGAEQRDQQRQAAAEQDRSHVGSLPPRLARRAVRSATDSSAAPRDAFTRTTSPAASILPHPGQCLVAPRRDDRLTRPARCGAARRATMPPARLADRHDDVDARAAA